MTIDMNRLNGMSREQLVQLAKETNTPHHHKNTKEKLVEAITNKIFEKPKQAEKKVELKPKETIFLTEAELEAALASIKEAKPAFSTVYDHENNCVTMRYNDGRYKHAETMNLSCSLTKFKRKAAEIAKGPLLMPTHSERDFEHVGATGKNAYTSVVLG